MKNWTRPGLLLTIIGVALIFMGLDILRDYDAGTWVMYAGFLVIGIVWVGSIWEVIVDEEMRYYQKMYWLLLTILLPVLGGWIFYLTHPQKAGSSPEASAAQ